MRPLFVSTVAVVTSSPADDHRLFVDALGLPLTGDDDYVFTHELAGVKHFGVWPLVEAAQACFDTDRWPVDRPVPRASIEFDVEDVTEAADELVAQGYELLHPPRTEPWGQTVARLQSRAVSSSASASSPRCTMVRTPAPGAGSPLAIFSKALSRPPTDQNAPTWPPGKVPTALVSGVVPILTISSSAVR